MMPVKSSDGDGRRLSINTKRPDPNFQHQKFLSFDKGARNEVFAMLQFSSHAWDFLRPWVLLTYIICCNFVSPERLLHIYSEKLVHARHCYFVNDYKQKNRDVLDPNCRTMDYLRTNLSFDASIICTRLILISLALDLCMGWLQQQTWIFVCSCPYLT